MPDTGKALTWDETGKRLYETGTKKGVLYTHGPASKFENGEAWNGLMSVTESPSGAEETALYADDIKYLGLRSAEEFGCKIEAYTTPDSWAKCDGTAELGTGVTIGQQTREPFCLCYRSIIGNDVKNNDYGYKLHLIYNGTASPTERGYKTVNETPEAITLSYEVKTTPVEVEGYKPTASLVIDSTKVDSAALAEIEKILYGSTEANARMIMPDEVKTILEKHPAAASASATPSGKK